MQIHFSYFMLITLVFYLCTIKNSAQIKLHSMTQTMPEQNTITNYPTIMNNDPPVRMCGNVFLQNLKRVCAVRGIYTPVKRLKRSTSKYFDLERMLQRRKRFDDLCTLYAIYEPDQVVTQCCCIGCTRNYLEQFCNPSY
ncbi:unnamed protein product [Schistosoma turkestanicum]|nr:unnamed protein product [Schistosoma turkestanicum]